MFNLERIMQLDIEYVKSFSEVEVCKEGLILQSGYPNLL